MIYDVTRNIYSGMNVYPGDPEVNFKRVLDIDGGGAEVHGIFLGTHTGTHVDAPRHILKDGKTIDRIEPEVFWGKAYLYSMKGKDCLDIADIISIRPVKRVIIKTGFTGSCLSASYPYISPGAASRLAAGPTVLLGIDTPSVDPPGTDQCHRILLGAGIVIVENLKLEGVPPGQYELACLPLPLLGLDGSPARVLLKNSN